MPVSFGGPGELRKTLNDGKFDLLKHAGEKIPCPLAAGVVVASTVVDGQFLAPNGAGRWEMAASPAKGLTMVFTAATNVIVNTAAGVAASSYVGDDRSDSPTGLFGFIKGWWPSATLFTGARGGGNVALASYTAGMALTVVNGKLCPANFGTVVGETVIGRVDLPAGANSSNPSDICASVTVE